MPATVYRRQCGFSRADDRVYPGRVRRGVFLLLPALVIGVIAGLSTIAAHQGDAAFIFNQQHPRTVQPRQFELVIAKTNEPLPSGPGKRASGAKCTPGTNGPKRNPWSCTVRYGSGRSITYSLEVQPTGKFKGVDRTGTRIVTGCCITGGTTATG
jgi:hypothetical protein